MVELVNFALMVIKLSASILYHYLPFTQKAAGAKEEWIPRDVDLDALEPVEIDELLAEKVKSMTESNNKSKGYPLIEKSKVISTDQL